MTTIEYLDRELRRVELSMRRAAKNPNAPQGELRGLQEKRENLCEARAAVLEMQARPEAGNPLTLEQLRGMLGKPVLLKSPRWTEWCIVREHGEHEIAGDAISFTRRHYGEVCLGLSDYGKTWAAYAYPHAHIDREKWEPCMWCALNGQFGLNNYCSACGRPLTEEAWAELERRVCGEV